MHAIDPAASAGARVPVPGEAFTRRSVTCVTATIVALSAERNRLAAEASAAGEKALALSAECHELAVREKRLLQSMASLESDLRSMTVERDGHARQSEVALQELQEIHASCAWKLVTSSRHLVAGILPAGTRRRRVFNAVFRRIAQRGDANLQTP